MLIVKSQRFGRLTMISESSGGKMKRSEIEAIAVELYGIIADDGKWEESLPSVKAFYRKIALWHLIKMEERNETF